MVVFNVIYSIDLINNNFGNLFYIATYEEATDGLKLAEAMSDIETKSDQQQHRTRKRIASRPSPKSNSSAGSDEEEEIPVILNPSVVVSAEDDADFSPESIVEPDGNFLGNFFAVQ